jgi:polysaccharide biosynthesis/export protein
MRSKKIVVGVTLIAFLGSDFTVGIAPALGQLSGNGSGQVPMPSLSGDGTFGRVLPGPSTQTPYQGVPQLPQQPQPQFQTSRPIAPATPNLCQPGGGTRFLQTATVPRSRAVETFVGPMAPVPQPVSPIPQPPIVTQVTVSQGPPQQVSQMPAMPPAEAQRAALQQTAPEVEELSRIEAAFNLDPIRQFAVPMGMTQPVSAQQVGAQQAAVQQTSQQQPQPSQQPQGMLGAFGAPLRQYGYSMFATNVSTFAPVDDIPVGPDYVLGPGDDLTINVWGAVDSTLVRTVDRNGRIVLPKVGDLRIWGLTFSQADRLIRDELARFFRGFQTSVTMGRLRTVNVYVVGEVCQPGVYTLSALSTVTNGLFSAGGPTKLGSLREVRLIRGGYQVARLDLYDFLQRGDRTRDYRLESGDTIFVPTIGDVVAVAGEVKRPAIYEIRSDTRLADVVGLAGGLTPTSYLKRVQVVRALPSSERITVDVDLTGYYLKGDEASNPPLNGGDLVLIHRSDPRIYNTVRVEGAVKYPGAYELKPMMRISELLPAEQLLPEAQPERIEVARRRPDLSLEIVGVNLKKAWHGDADADLLLKPLDEVTVRTELKAVRTITLTGQVVRPGVYAVAEGERLSSVLERAGGYTDRAFLKGAVFTRASLRKIEAEQLDNFLKAQEQRILATASTVTVGAEKEEVAAQQQSIQARREMLKLLASKVVVGRMVIHLDVPDRLNGTGDDVVLIEGDTLEVPEPPQSVLVIGSVRTSTSVQHKPGANAEYYINRVGGFSKEADKKETHIVKADGSAVSSFTNVRDVEPGDSIIVPPKAEEKIRALPTIRDIVQTIGSALLGLAALAALGI